MKLILHHGSLLPAEGDEGALVNCLGIGDVIAKIKETREIVTIEFEDNWLRFTTRDKEKVC